MAFRLNAINLLESFDGDGDQRILGNGREIHLGREAWRSGKLAFDLLTTRPAALPEDGGVRVFPMDSNDDFCRFCAELDSRKDLDAIIGDFLDDAGSSHVVLIDAATQKPMSVDALAEVLDYPWHSKVLLLAQIVDGAPGSVASSMEASGLVRGFKEHFLAAALLLLDDAAIAAFCDDFGGSIDLVVRCHWLVQFVQRAIFQSELPRNPESHEIRVHVLSALGKKAAEVRHAENHAMKKQVWEWCVGNRARYRSRERAAEAASTLVPVTHRTVRDWIEEWDKRVGPE